MNFQPQFVLIYIYNASSLEPLYYGLCLAKQEKFRPCKTLSKSEDWSSVYIADKKFFSESNVAELEWLEMSFIIPLMLDNQLIPYNSLKEIEQSENYFEFGKRFVFYLDTVKKIHGTSTFFWMENSKSRKKLTIWPESVLCPRTIPNQNSIKK